MSDKTLVKAKSYLTEGKIKVKEFTPHAAVFTARGSQEYTILFSKILGFVCNCPAKTVCAHIEAVKLICDPHSVDSPSLGGTDQGLQDFLDKFPANRPDDGELF